MAKCIVINNCGECPLSKLVSLRNNAYYCDSGANFNHIETIILADKDIPEWCPLETLDINDLQAGIKYGEIR